MRSAVNSHESGSEVQYFAAGANTCGRGSAGLGRIADGATRTTASLHCRACAAAARARAALGLLPMVALLLVLVPASVRGQEVWFGPRTPDYGVPGVKDWAMMFHPNAEWDQLAVQMQVFLAAAGFYLITPDDQLKAMASDLSRRHIALAMETGAVAQKPNEPCSQREGYPAPWVTPKVVEKLTRLGIRLQFIRMDGTLWFGHYDPAGCKLPLSEITPRVVETMRPYLQAFPGVVIGDVEGVQALSQFPDWQANYLALKSNVERALGRKLMFLHLDIDWQQPDWPTAIAAAARLAHGTGEKLGVIYNDGLAATDQAWVADAKRHFDELETRYGLIPDQAVFHTWADHPTHIFPKTSDSAHSYLIAQYLLPRTHLVVQRTATGVQGLLSQVSGQPVAGARISIDVLGDDPSRPPLARDVSGTVPPKARFAVLGLRVNTECWCSGANDLLLGTLSYQETSGGSVRYAYRYAPPARTQAGLAVTPDLIADQPLVHLKVAPGGSVGFNSPVFPVTPGAQFRFQVPLASLNGSGMFGTAAVIFMDARQQGFQRANITVGNDAAPAAAAVTDVSGRFAAALPENMHWRERPLLLHYAGSPTLRAAYAAPQ